MEEKHISEKAADGAGRPKGHGGRIKRGVCLLACICFLFQAVSGMTQAWAAEKQAKASAGDMAGKAVAFSELNDDAVFIKQSQPGLCTLASAAMMVRRAAMLSGSQDWKKITESSVRKDAWVEKVGLKWNFKSAGITVAYKTLSSKNELISLLDKHPEGVVIYNTQKPHAILITDYTDGVFYCCDPAQHKPTGRYPVSSASITVESAGCCWYVKNPVNLVVVMDEPDDKNSNEDLTGNLNGDSNRDLNTGSNKSLNKNSNENLNGELQGDSDGKQGGAADYEAGGLTYQILDEAGRTAICTGQAGDGTKVTVPDTVKLDGETYKVVKIGADAFSGSAKLKSVTVGTNVVSIARKAFYQCRKLKTVIINSWNIQEIGADAFASINKKAQILILADEVQQVEVFTSLLSGTSVPGTVSIGVQ